VTTRRAEITSEGGRHPAGDARPQNLGLGSWPRRRSTLTPDRIAWSFEGEHTTFAEIDRRVEQLAGALAARGVAPGDRVAYFGTNHPALLETLFAAGRIGAIAVIVNARLAPRELDFILGDSSPRVLVVGRDQLPVVAALDRATRPELVLAAEGSALEVPPLDALRDDAAAPPPVAVGLDDPCLIMYTSGTTGHPKGATLSHGNMLFSALNVILSSDLRIDDVCLAAAPLFHIAGLNGLVLPVFLKGGRSVLHRSFDPARALDALRGDAITSMFAVPAMLDAVAALPGFEHAEFPP
jgi:Acyl-CoA synthetases (AMP-forming)/AMP-acid ligases II